MSSRREQKDRLRQERLAAEQAAKAQAARKRRMQILAGGAGAVIIAVVVVVIVLASGGSSSASIEYHTNSVPSGGEIGVTTKPPPWRPNYSHLAQRLKTMGLPQ